MYDKILIPTDGSDCSDKAIGHGLELAQITGATLTFLYVIESIPPVMMAEAYNYAMYSEQLAEDLRNAADQALESALAQAKQAGVEAEGKRVEFARPINSIAEQAREHDLVIMGSHGRTGMGRIILGSVTEGVLRESQTPLLVVRCTKDEQA
ncbi:MAG: universal stress protein [Trueperaceae bacterium]|nr:universal stress protein [Trueperaceae bacterium]